MDLLPDTVYETALASAKFLIGLVPNLFLYRRKLRNSRKTD